MNLANKISLSRILLIPVFIVLFYGACLWNWGVYAGYAAILVFLLASFTDFLDGWAARKYKLVSDLGKLLDPLADKLLIMSVMVCLVSLGMIDAWVVVLVLAREFLITGLRAAAAADNVVIAASRLAKAKTVSQIIAVTLVLTDVFVCGLIFGGVGIPYIFVIIMVILTVYSGADYMYKNRRLFKN